MHFYILDCDDVTDGNVKDISSRCIEFATLQKCKKNEFIRQRCQESCGVCVGGKYCLRLSNVSIVDCRYYHYLNQGNYSLIYCVLIL